MIEEEEMISSPSGEDVITSVSEKDLIDLTSSEVPLTRRNVSKSKWSSSPWTRGRLSPAVPSHLGLAVALEEPSERTSSPGRPRYISAESDDEEEEEVISRFHAFRPSEQGESTSINEDGVTRAWAWTSTWKGSPTSPTDSRSLYDTEDEEDWSDEEVDEHVVRAIREEKQFARYFGSGPLLTRCQSFLWDQLCIPFLHGCVWGVVGHVWKWWWKHPRRGQGGGIKL